MDNIFIIWKSKAEHGNRLHAVLQRLQQAEVTLNKEKFLFSQSLVKFVGHLVSQGEVKPDPDKDKAIQKMPEPTRVGDVRRFLGVIN